MLGITAIVQMLIFLGTGSVALLADLVHNLGDALTALPVGLALVIRSEVAERWSGKAVVVAIFVSACVAVVASVDRLLNPRPLEHLLVIASAGAVGSSGTRSPR